MSLKYYAFKITATSPWRQWIRTDVVSDVFYDGLDVANDLKFTVQMKYATEYHVD